MIIFLLLAITSFHIFLLSRLLFFPYPELFVYPYLTQAGFVPYKQIFDQHFPGVMFFPVNLASVGIDTPGEMRVLSYLLIAASHLFIFLISRKVFKSKFYLLIPNFMFLIWQPFFEGYVLWIDSFSQVLLLAAFYIGISLRKDRPFRFFLLGLVLGISLLFKQVMLPLIFLLTIYLWIKFRSVKHIFLYFLGGVIPVLYLLHFVYQKQNFDEFFFWTVEFNLTTFSQMGRKYASLGEAVKSFPVFGFSFLIFLYILYRKRAEQTLLCIFFFGALVFAYARFDFVHLQPSLPFAIFLIVLFFQPQKQRVFFYLFLLFSSLFTLSYYRHMVSSHILFYGEDEMEIVKAIEEKTDPGDKIFAFGTLPHIYQMTRTIPAGETFVFQFHWFMEEAEDEILEGLLGDPPKVVIRDSEASVAGVNLTKYASKIDGFINANYQTDRKMGNIEIMIPN